MIRGTWLSTSAFPYVAVGVRVPDFSDEWRLVPFAIDTGAGHTTLHPREALRIFGLQPMDLDPSNWGMHTTGHGIGGSLRYMILPAQFAFQDPDTGEVSTFDSDIQVGELTADSLELPSLLGWDLLQHFRTVFDGRDSVTLEPRPI